MDWKVRGGSPIARHAAVPNHKLACEVIERRTEILGDITSDEGDAIRRTPPELSTDGIADIRIALSNYSIRVGIRVCPKFPLKCIKVFKAPGDFESGLVQGAWHG